MRYRTERKVNLGPTPQIVISFFIVSLCYFASRADV
jgi:hypothetical protein